MRIVGGRHRGRILSAPQMGKAGKTHKAGAEIRPTADRTREALFNQLCHSHKLSRALGREDRPFLDEKTSFVDLFAGTGAVALEALSRGAALAVLVEKDPGNMALIQRNLSDFGALDKAILLRQDATALPPCPISQGVDLVFMDAPYRQGLSVKALESLQQQGWLHALTLVIVELAAKGEAMEIPEAFRLLEDRRHGAARLLFLAL